MRHQSGADGTATPAAKFLLCTEQSGNVAPHHDDGARPDRSPKTWLRNATQASLLRPCRSGILRAPEAHPMDLAFKLNVLAIFVAFTFVSAIVLGAF